MSLLNALHRPYPDDVYTGDGGEHIAWLRRCDTAPDLVFAGGGSCEYLATGDQTGACTVCTAGRSARTSRALTVIFTGRSLSRSSCWRVRCGSMTASPG